MFGRVINMPFYIFCWFYLNCEILCSYLLTFVFFAINLLSTNQPVNYYYCHYYYHSCYYYYHYNYYYYYYYYDHHHHHYHHHHVFNIYVLVVVITAISSVRRVITNDQRLTEYSRLCISNTFLSILAVPNKTVYDLKHWLSDAKCSLSTKVILQWCGYFLLQHKDCALTYQGSTGTNLT